MSSVPDELLLARIKREQEAREAAIASLRAEFDELLLNATEAADKKIVAAASKLTSTISGRTVSSSAIAGTILRTQVEPGFALAEQVTLLEAKVTDGQNSSLARIEEVRRATATLTDATAEQILTIRAQFNNNVAQFRDQITAQANATSASVSRITTLEASVNNPTTGLVAAHARITTEETVRVTQTSALASRSTTLEATVNNPTTGVAAAHARITTEETARATAVEAVATRASTLEATVNNPTTGLAASHARITTEETARATAVDAVATRATTLEATVNNPTTGLAASHARITSEESARATAVSAVASRTSSLEATVNNPTTGMTATFARITAEETARATAVEAVATRTSGLEASVNNATTGLNAAHSRISTEETARATAVSAVATRTTALEATVNDATTGVAAAHALIAAEQQARANADGSLASSIASASASIAGKNKTFLQSATPTASSAGDLWIDTGNGNALKRWDGAAWQNADVASGAIGAAVSTEATARAQADGFLSGKYTLAVAAGNVVTGMTITSSTGTGTPVSDVTFSAGAFRIYNTGTGSSVAPFQVVGNQVRITGSLVLSNSDINGLGSLATANSVDLTTQVTNRSLANLDTYASSKLDGIAAGADVTLGAINGGLVITSGGLTLNGTPAIKSADYVAGVSGWAIKGDGSVEFDSGVFRGIVRAAVIDYAPLIGAGGPGLSAVMDWQHTGAQNWRTDINDSDAAFRLFNPNATSGSKIVELGVGGHQLDRVKVWGDLQLSGGGYGYGDFTSYSSRALKDQVTPIGSALSQVLRLTPVDFTWKTGAPKTGRDFGLIAEDVEQIFPLAVVRDKEGTPAVNYAKLSVYLLRAVQELASRN